MQVILPTVTSPIELEPGCESQLNRADGGCRACCPSIAACEPSPVALFVRAVERHHALHIAVCACAQQRNADAAAREVTCEAPVAHERAIDALSRRYDPCP